MAPFMLFSALQVTDKLIKQLNSQTVCDQHTQEIKSSYGIE